MTGKKKIIVACGSAVATSTVVAEALEKALKEREIPVEIVHCKADEVESLLDGTDLVVSTTPLNLKSDVPVIVTLAFVTGVGKTKVLEEIVSKLE